MDVDDLETLPAFLQFPATFARENQAASGATLAWTAPSRWRENASRVIRDVRDFLATRRVREAVGSGRKSKVLWIAFGLTVALCMVSADVYWLGHPTRLPRRVEVSSEAPPPAPIASAPRLVVGLPSVIGQLPNDVSTAVGSDLSLRSPLELADGSPTPIIGRSGRFIQTRSEVPQSKALLVT